MTLARIARAYHERVIGYSGKLQALNENNTAQLNTLVNQSIGLGHEPRFNEGTLEDAGDVIGSKFDTIKNRLIYLDPGYQQRVASALRNYGRLAEPDPQVAGTLAKWANPEDLPAAIPCTSKATGARGVAVPGDVLLKDRSTLASQASDTGNWDVVNAIDEAVTNSLPNSQQPLWNEARNQYRNLLSARKGVRSQHAGPGQHDEACCGAPGGQ